MNTKANKAGATRRTQTAKPGNAEIAAQAKAWDDARSALKLATEKRNAEQAALDGLPPEAGDEARHERLEALAAAEAELATAQAAIEALSSNGPVLPAQPETSAATGKATEPKREPTRTAIALQEVRWQGRTFGVNEPIVPDMPETMAADLAARGIVALD